MAGASERKKSLHKEHCCPGFVDRISTDVQPDQMACTSETEGEAGDRGIKTQSWRGTRTRARHRPTLSYASTAMCI